MVTVQYVCKKCGKPFSFLQMLKPGLEGDRDPLCPYCLSDKLVFVSKETFNRRSRKASAVAARIFLDDFIGGD